MTRATAVRVALAVIVFAVAEDAFLSPAPGTTAGDHLAAGLVPVAIALVIAAAYPRLREGVRGALLSACGALALTAGAVTLTPGALAGAAAGIGLVAIGIADLWQSRHRSGSRRRRIARRAGLAVAGVVGAYLLVLPVGLAIVVNHAPPAATSAPDLGRPAVAARLVTSDGLRLRGWYVPSRNRAAVIAFPGHRGPVRHARLLARHGYGVLLLDRRGEGASQGDFNRRGWNGEADLVAAIDYLRGRPDVDPERIGGIGLSVGGELLLQTAAHDQRLAAVVSEGAGVRSLAEQMHTPDVPRALRWLSPALVETAAGTVLAGSGPPPDLTDLMPRIAPRPVLLIRALRGNADEELNRVYFGAAREPKALWEVAAGGHTGALAAAPAAYERRVVGFFDRALTPQGGTS